MLFILSLFYCQNAVGRSLMVVTVLSILLSWGHNFPAFTNWMIDNFPMYNKFRAVSSILVVAEFTIPLLAALTLARIFSEPKLLREKPIPLYISFGITAGLCALFALMPGAFFGDCLTSHERDVIGELRNVLSPETVNAFAGNNTSGNSLV